MLIKSYAVPVYFKDEQDKNGRKTYNASLIPNRGAWLKFETDKNDLLHVRVDKTRKINAHVMMRAIGLSDNDVLDKLRHPEYYRKSIEAANEEGISSEDQALLELYKKLRPGEPPSVSGGQQLLHSRFSTPSVTTLVGLADTKSIKNYASQSPMR